MGFRKGSIGSIMMEGLNQLKQDREMYIETLKQKYPTDSDLDKLMLTICTYNAVIAEFEHVIEVAKENKSKGSK